MHEFFSRRNVRVLVFGKTGQGSTEIQRQAKVIALGSDQVNLMSAQACADAITLYNPSIVINAAAWTDVDRAEEHEAQALLVNGRAPAVMARRCESLGIPFLHISTDYVFDGTGKAALCETDLTAPKNAYGRTKLAGEEAVSATNSHWAILRTSWVFSAYCDNFVKTMLRLSMRNTYLSVVSDQFGCPTPASDVAATLLTLGRAMLEGSKGGLYHYAGQPPVSWADFAREIFRQAARNISIVDIDSKSYPSRAVRPFNTSLDCSKIMTDFGVAAPDWRVGLRAVLQDLNEKD